MIIIIIIISRNRARVSEMLSCTLVTDRYRPFINMFAFSRRAGKLKYVLGFKGPAVKVLCRDDLISPLRILRFIPFVHSAKSDE